MENKEEKPHYVVVKEYSQDAFESAINSYYLEEYRIVPGTFSHGNESIGNLNAGQVIYSFSAIIMELKND